MPTPGAPLRRIKSPVQVGDPGNCPQHASDREAADARLDDGNNLDGGKKELVTMNFDVNPARLRLTRSMVLEPVCSCIY
ncbi:hypothetical protein [Mycobacterium deserti]|uniref:Uncharacterized protein n=1 Tax=Mycobacterium deserti TaxID=2978347 RepID=A0ABT2M6Z0_9MYCO|nr:hypothetical protein [Mycobacterium deserti]MCT7658027.1 hypothetical protein [Mycobacterium deserti]